VYWTQSLIGGTDNSGFELGADAIALNQLNTAEKSLERLFVTYDLVLGNNVSYLISDARIQCNQLMDSVKKLGRTDLLREQTDPVLRIQNHLKRLLDVLASTAGPGPDALTVFDDISIKLIADFRTLNKDAVRQVRSAEMSLTERRKTVRLLVIGGSVGYVLLILLAAFSVSRVIAAPLRDLTEIAKGSLSELRNDVRVVTGPSEFVQLSSELKRLVNSLEETVATRTHMLKAKSEDLIGEVSERKRAQEGLQDALTELQSMQAVLVQQERLKALGEMVSGIAHDFNNILTPIMSYSVLLRDDRSLPEVEQVECLNLIHTASQDAAGMIQRMRAFSKPGLTSHTAMIDLDQIVSDAVAFAKPRWLERTHGATGEIEIKVMSEDRVFAVGVEGEIRQALLNLLFNAADAIEGDGSITVATGRDQRFAWISVSDTGTGMTPAVLAKCREPFFSTKDSRGTGLGLPMVFSTAGRHGGHVDIESELGKGSTFTFRIPLDANIQTQIEPFNETMAQRLITNGAVDVLIVDDDEVCRRVVGRGLVQEGHRLIVVEDAATALLVADAQSIDLMVTDLNMPGMNGDELAAEIRRRQPKCFIVIFTGRVEEVSESGRKAANLILSKPMDVHELASQIFAKV
jgi:signal transduction histidine kinase